MARYRFRLFKALGLTFLALGTGVAQTNVVTNGGFESGLAGWSAAPSVGNGINVTCSFNASTAGGTETLTGTPSLPPFSGTGLAMGGMRNTGSGNGSCVLYQDVAIPAGATTATINLRWGEIRVGSVSVGQAALLARLYSSTSTVPYYLTSGTGNITFFQPVSSNTELVSATSGSFNVSALAGTTARLALFIAMTGGADATRGLVGGFDNVELLVTVPATVSQSFGAVSIPLLGTTSLSYTVTNPASASTAITSAGFTNNLPAGLVVATPNGLTGSCDAGTVTAVAGSGSVSLSGATLAPGSSCTFSVNVAGTTSGVKINSVTLTSSAGTGNTSTASLQVIAPPTITSVSPSSGTLAGGNTVTITGTGFTGATALTFGGIAATSFTVVNATTITATVPAKSTAGAASVLVTTPGGSNAENTLYQYLGPPTITSISPSSGPPAGGTAVTITGTGFTGATALTFGGIAATSFAVADATTIIATVPPSAAGTAGPVSVVVVTPYGANAANTLYEYAQPIPTLSEWGMIGLAALLVLYGYRRLRRHDGIAGTA
ncbi:MAG TPA: IPTL-CTERM sorting domain-containing protein [Bryobacteraceae bacterium]|nr:IPTL-CTERM sorting domain-containing protein [Bryobacteraceae bacterium]